MSIAPPSRPRILIVEDEAVTAADLQTTIQALGYESLGIVNSGRKAVEASREISPDAVLMDVGLKGSMDGIAAAEEIRRNWSIPVIFITGNPNEDTLLRANAAGAYGFVLKPFRMKDLNATILVALQQHRLARELFSEQTWLRTMLERLTDGVIATDVEGHVRYLNPVAQTLTGCTLEEAIGKPIEDVYKLTTISKEPLELYQLRRALRLSSPIGKSRFLMTTRNGRIIPIEDAASPISVSGHVVGAVTIFSDITERVRREKELGVERERLEQQVQVTTQALGDTRAELRALSGHLMQAQEDERRRVARELHDDLNQRAAIAEIELSRIEPLLAAQDRRVHQILAEARQQIALLSTGLREVSHRLHPAAVEDLGLPAALRALVNDYRESGADVSFAGHQVTPDVPLPTATALYRIAQEALRNAFKHGRGAPVRVVLEETDAELRLRVEDAGPGFEVDRVRGKGGLGLLSMQERARLVEGSLLLRTRPGEGTQIMVRVPLGNHFQSPSAQPDVSLPQE